MIFRQGDVLVVSVDSIPSEVTAVKRENGSIVLAHGEVTGHCHAIKNRVAKFYEAGTGERYLDLQQQSALTHQEHGTINIPAGKYKVIRQREYTPEAIRNVAD